MKKSIARSEAASENGAAVVANPRTPAESSAGHVSRRTFLEQVGVGGCALGAAILVGCESAELLTDPNAGLTKDAPFNLTTHPGLKTVPGGTATLNAEGLKLFLLRKDEFTVLAYEEKCPHQACPFAQLGVWDDKKKQLVCNCHGSRFEVDGSYVDGSVSGDWANATAAKTWKVTFDKATGEGVVKAG